MAGRNGTNRSIAAVAGMPRLNTSMPIREKRTWQNRLLNRQEAAERAVEAIEDEMLAAYEAGMSYATIGGIISVHPTTAKDMCDRADKRRVEEGNGSRS